MVDWKSSIIKIDFLRKGNAPVDGSKSKLTGKHIEFCPWSCLDGRQPFLITRIDVAMIQKLKLFWSHSLTVLARGWGVFWVCQSLTQDWVLIKPQYTFSSFTIRRGLYSYHVTKLSRVATWYQAMSIHQGAYQPSNVRLLQFSFRQILKLIQRERWNFSSITFSESSITTQLLWWYPLNSTHRSNLLKENASFRKLSFYIY